jgi:glycosyltransferase involved in cell wall biosynthesis
LTKTDHMIRINFPGKVFARNTGGNSTYAKNLEIELKALGISTLIHHVNSSQLGKFRNGLDEATLQFKVKEGLLHFPSDTGMLLGTKLPVVSTIHGVASAHIPKVRGTSAETLWRIRVRLMGDYSDAIVTPSESSKRDIVKLFGFREELVHVIPHGISHQEFNPTRTAHDDELQSVFPNLPENFALYLGNLDPRKNVITVLKALESPKWPVDLMLVIVGNMAWGTNETLRAILQHPRVVYLGQVPQIYVAPLFRRSTVFLFPSLYEGFGFPVLEALACGTAVITTSRGSLKDLVSDELVQLLNDPRDAATLALLVSKVYFSDSGFKNMRIQGINHVKKFTWSASAKRHLEIYRSLL